MALRHRLTGTCIGTVAAGLLVSGGVFGENSAHAMPADDGYPVPAGVASIPMGAYLDYGPVGIQRMEQLSRWLGGAELKVGHTYLPGDRWVNIEGGHSFLDAWAEWRQGADDRLFVLNVPMMERNESRLSDRRVRRLLRAGAAGQFDHHFRTLATRLVDLGVPDTVIVLGWEMNGVTYTHRCGPDPESWKTYWKRIVTAMRSVPGQEFRFDFAPNRGRDAIPWTECYPGDDVVDIIGMDSYDQPPGGTFEDQVTTPYGLQKQVEFAAAHNKVISYPEWGLFRNGDNPEYMRGMLDWIEQHKPLYQTITDYCPHGVWQCDDNPMSSKVFQSKLFAQPTPVEPTPSPVTPTPVPTPSAVTPTPTPVEPTPSPASPTSTMTPTPVEPTPVPTPSPVTPTPTPTPVEATPTPTPTPSAASPTPTPTPTPTPVEPTPVPTPTPSAATPTPTPSPATPTPTPSPATPTPAPTPSPLTPTPTPTPSPSSVTPTPTPTPSSVTPTPTPTPSPVTPTPTPAAPTPTPTPVEPEPVESTPVPAPASSKPPTPKPVPPTPGPEMNSDEWCVKLDLGAWVSQWISPQKICVTFPWPVSWPF